MEKLPVEILTKIIDYLTPPEQVQLQSVSKRFFALARDNNIWRLHSYENTWAALLAARPRTNGASESLVANSTASLSSLGQPSLRSLIQPQPNDANSDTQPPTFGERARAAAAWDPSAEGENVDWYSEYIARNGPVSLSWLQQPFSRTQGGGKAYIEVKGMGLLRDWSLARQNKVISPLSDGSVCIWDLNHSHSIGSRVTKGSILGTSAPGILTVDMSQRKENSAAKSALEFINLGECVSVDSIRQMAYLAVGHVVNEVDLETLRVVSQQRYPWSVFALSQETDYSVPLTLATTLGLHIYDGRLSKTEEEETINLRCEPPTVSLVPESLIYTPPDSPLLQFQSNGRPPHRIRSPDPSETTDNYAPLFQPGPLAILHPPAPHVNSIFLAGRFPSILQYDRRYFPKLQRTIHSGGRLCGLASVPAPQFPVFSGSRYLDSSTVVACGEYNGKGSLELYSLTASGEDDRNWPSASSSFPSNPKTQQDSTSVSGSLNIPDVSSRLRPSYQNRQSAASSKILSVQSHGTRIVYSDGDGNIKWVERDGRTEVRRLNINSYRPLPGTGMGSNSHAHSHGGDEAFGVSGLWANISRAQNEGDVARKVLPTGGCLTGDELLVWTGDRVGRIRFSDTPDADEIGEDDEMSLDGDDDEEARSRKRELQAHEREYSTMMRRALETQADEVRRMGGFGL